MDLIDLYHRRGISLVRSKLGRSPAARRGYCKLARLYAEQIERQRAERSPDAIEFIPAL
ncbi:hypothetical protein [Sphingomonas crusticola]|uniref:hypothetical protein n=1 Tax=Sphingomonas crusticola TaxID=1697973 RepID=UPI0013C31509|nr:hypothetical protein [Sphingomonas crusticola]